MYRIWKCTSVQNQIRPQYFTKQASVLLNKLAWLHLVLPGLAARLTKFGDTGNKHSMGLQSRWRKLSVKENRSNTCAFGKISDYWPQECVLIFQYVLLRILLTTTVTIAFEYSHEEFSFTKSSIIINIINLHSATQSAHSPTWLKLRLIKLVWKTVF